MQTTIFEFNYCKNIFDGDELRPLDDDQLADKEKKEQWKRAKRRKIEPQPENFYKDPNNFYTSSLLDFTVVRVKPFKSPAVSSLSLTAETVVQVSRNIYVSD